MPKGTQLSYEEQVKIRSFREINLSNREIARRLRRSKTVVDNFLNLGPFYGKQKRKGRTPKVTQRQRRQIIRSALIKNNTATQIKSELGLPIEKRRIQQILSNNENVVWTKRMKKPSLTKRHIIARLEFAKKYMNWTEQWRQVIFSDEKKFNLDGPDGCQYYWHDLRKEKEVRMSRNFGGGSVMIWMGFSYKGTTPLCFITSRMNSTTYIELLEDALIEYGDEIAGPDWIFQHDNASIHASRATKSFLDERQIEVLDHPAVSPDMNPIENLWGIIARKVYANGRQFYSVAELKAQIKVSVREIPLKTLQSLIDSMPNRIFALIKANGKSTKY